MSEERIGVGNPRSDIFLRHNDFAYTLRQLAHNDLSKVNFDSLLSGTELFRDFGEDQTDLPRLRAGRVGGQVWIIC